MKAENLLWNGKRNFSQKARKSEECDVTITKSIVKGKSKARLTFRNGMASIVSETDYIQFAVPDGRHIYFMSGTKDTGLKLSASGNNSSDNRYVTINKENDAEMVIPFTGDYSINFDKECGYYFIKKG